MGGAPLSRTYGSSPSQSNSMRADEEVRRVYRRSLTVVVVSQALGGAGLAAGVTVGALLAEDMLGTTGLAGLPAALFTLGSALAAYLVGRFSQRLGRRMGLTLGFSAGSLGAAGIVTAAVLENPMLFFLSLFIYGSGTATNLQARYAGTDLAPARRRATAVSIAMVATTIGAVAGPNLVGATGAIARSVGVPELAGPFLLAAVAYGLAGVVLLTFLRPDPLLVARSLAEGESAGLSAPVARTRAESTADGVLLGALVMVLAQISMVAIMTMTPVHMRFHGHDLTQVGFVIGVHIGFMFLPSLVTGMLVDRIGHVRMALVSGATLLSAGIVAATAPGDSVGTLAVALALLGLGWNLGLISGTAMIVDATPLATRARTQGSVDVLIAIAGAAGGALSGWVVDATSYATLTIAGGGLALLLLPAEVLGQSNRDRLVVQPE